MKDLMFVLEKALTESGALILNGYMSHDSSYTHKSDFEVVTKWDLESERIIKDVIHSSYPLHSFIAEESGGQSTKEGTWIIDPIDGTTNFVHKFPFFCSSIAYMKDGELLAGGVYAPVLGDLYMAEKGGGAYKNGKKIEVSEVKSLDASLLATGFHYERKDDKDNLISFMDSAIQKVQGIRRCGSAALDLCFTACGNYDLYIEYGIHSWDIAAGILLVEEAGGKVTNTRGGKLDIFSREIAASNGLVHDEAIKELII